MTLTIIVAIICSILLLVLGVAFLGRPKTKQAIRPKIDLDFESRKKLEDKLRF